MTKITEKKLRQIIIEEAGRALRETQLDPSSGDMPTGDAYAPLEYCGAELGEICKSGIQFMNWNSRWARRDFFLWGKSFYGPKGIFKVDHEEEEYFDLLARKYAQLARGGREVEARAWKNEKKRFLWALRERWRHVEKCCKHQY